MSASISSASSRFLLGIRSPLESGGPELEQPVAQRMRCPHVVVVVGRDRPEVVLVAVVGEGVVGEDGAGALVDLVASLVSGQNLEVLEAVGLDPRLD